MAESIKQAALIAKQRGPDEIYIDNSWLNASHWPDVEERKIKGYAADTAKAKKSS